MSTIISDRFISFVRLYFAHFGIILKYTRQNNPTERGGFHVRTSRAHARALSCGHLRGAPDGQAAARRDGPGGACRDHSRERPRRRAHAGPRHSAVFRSCAHRGARGARGAFKHAFAQKPPVPPPAQRSARHHHPQGAARP